MYIYTPEDRTVEQLAGEFDCDLSLAARLLELYREGLEHGRNGYYPDGEYASDADWANGTGVEIRDLESELEDDCGEVFDLYCEGHSIGLEEHEGSDDDA